MRPAQRLGETFLQALDDLAAKSEHPELATVPWCLWGHSGGGFWASLMQTSYPERVVAVWLRSGTAFAAWEKGEIPKPEIPEAAYRIPVMCNPGAKEKDDKRFSGAWTGSLAMFRAYRAKGARDRLRPRPAHRPRVRRLALPRHPVLRRLPGCRACPTRKGAEAQADATRSAPGWPRLLGDKAEARRRLSRGDAEEAVWLPDERVAKAWMEYVKTGARRRHHAAAGAVRRQGRPARSGGVEITWDAEADFESGIGVRHPARRQGDRPGAGEADRPVRPAAVPVDVLPRHARERCRRCATSIRGEAGGSTSTRDRGEQRGSELSSEEADLYTLRPRRCAPWPVGPDHQAADAGEPQLLLPKPFRPEGRNPPNFSVLIRFHRNNYPI